MCYEQKCLTCQVLISLKLSQDLTYKSLSSSSLLSPTRQLVCRLGQSDSHREGLLLAFGSATQLISYEGYFRNVSSFQLPVTSQ